MLYIVADVEVLVFLPYSRFHSCFLLCGLDTCEIDFMAVSSYGSGTESSGEVKIIKDLDRPIEGYDLLLVEDILDSVSFL